MGYKTRLLLGEAVVEVLAINLSLELLDTIRWRRGGRVETSSCHKMGSQSSPLMVVAFNTTSPFFTSPLRDT